MNSLADKSINFTKPKILAFDILKANYTRESGRKASS